MIIHLFNNLPTPLKALSIVYFILIVLCMFAGIKALLAYIKAEQ